MGYLNGTIVELPSGEKAFFVNTVSGKRVSGMMTESIFSSLVTDEVKDALGVREIVLLGEQNTRNINFSIIQNVYNQSRGKAVRISFPDAEVRRMIGGEVIASGYDSAENLQNANYLNAPTSELSVKVKKRDFGISLERGISARERLSEGEEFIIFINGPATALRLGINIPDDLRVTRTYIDQLFPDGMSDNDAIMLVRYVLLNSKNTDPEAFKFIFSQVPKNTDDRTISFIVKFAIRERIDPEALKVLFSRIPGNIKGKYMNDMVETALIVKIDPEALKILLGRIPEGIENEWFTNIFRMLMLNKVDPEVLNFLLHRIPQSIENEDIMFMVNTALNVKIDLEILKLLLNRIPENGEGRYIRTMIDTALESESGFVILQILFSRIPEDIESRYINEIWDAVQVQASRNQLTDGEIKYFRERLEDLKRQRGIE